MPASAPHPSRWRRPTPAGSGVPPRSAATPPPLPAAGPLCRRKWRRAPDGLNCGAPPRSAMELHPSWQQCPGPAGGGAPLPPMAKLPPQPGGGAANRPAEVPRGGGPTPRPRRTAPAQCSPAWSGAACLAKDGRGATAAAGGGDLIFPAATLRLSRRRQPGLAGTDVSSWPSAVPQPVWRRPPGTAATAGGGPGPQPAETKVYDGAPPQLAVAPRHGRRQRSVQAGRGDPAWWGIYPATDRGIALRECAQAVAPRPSRRRRPYPASGGVQFEPAAAPGARQQQRPATASSDAPYTPAETPRHRRRRRPTSASGAPPQQAPAPRPVRR